MVTVLMVFSITIFSTYSLENSVNQAYVSQISGMTEAINGRYEVSRSVKDVQQIFDYIKNKDERVLELRLYDKQGVVLASSEREWIGQTLENKSIRIPEQDTTLIERLPRGFELVPRLRLLAPLQEDDVVVGVVDVLLDTTEESNIVSKRVRLIIALGVISAALLLLVLWFVIRRIIIVPLMQLREIGVKGFSV